MGAKNDLRRMLTRRARIDPHPGGPAPSPSNALARRSAVLILAGARETILAPGASAEDAVPADTDILLTIRSTKLRHHPGQVAFPGGGIEGGDDSAAAAALREAREETGIAPESVEILGSLPEIMLPASGNLVPRSSGGGADRALFWWMASRRPMPCAWPWRPSSTRPRAGPPCSGAMAPFTGVRPSGPPRARRSSGDSRAASWRPSSTGRAGHSPGTRPVRSPSTTECRAYREPAEPRARAEPTSSRPVPFARGRPG